jgi:hypothetical protein
MKTDYLTVRAGSTNYAYSETTRRVKESYFHEWYNPSNGDYNVAVLKVCIDFYIPIDSA